MRKILVPILLLSVLAVAFGLRVQAGPPTDPTERTIKKFFGIEVWDTATFMKSITIAPDTTGGDRGVRSEIQALPRIKMVSLGTGTDGGTESVTLSSDAQDSSWVALSSLVTVSASSTHFRVGSTALKLAFTGDGDPNDPNDVLTSGAQLNITNDDWSSNESVGFWIYSEASLASGDLRLLVDDTSDDTFFNVPAVPAKKWTWVKVSIASLDGTTGNVVDKIDLVLSVAGVRKAAANPFSLYADNMYKWDSANEEDLGTDILQDGVLSVLSMTTDPNLPSTTSDLIENTDYFVDYRSGDDSLVWTLDMSAASATSLVAY